MIVQPTAITTSMTATQATCGNNNGTASVAAVGGTGSYTYFWNPISASTSTASGLSAGNYSITVTDANNCSSTQSVSVTANSSPSVTASSTTATCGNNNGTATATSSGGTPGYTYLWSNGQTNFIATNLATGNYTITVSDANNCSSTQTVSVAVSSSPS